MGSFPYLWAVRQRWGVPYLVGELNEPGAQQEHQVGDDYCEFGAFGHGGYHPLSASPMANRRDDVILA